MKKLVLAMTLLLSSAAANAFYLPPGQGFNAGGQAEDDNLDYHLDANGNIKSGAFAVGDILTSFYEFNSIIDLIAPFDATQVLNKAADELVGLATVKIKSISGSYVELEAVSPGATVIELYKLGSEVNFDPVTCANFTACKNAVVDGDLWLTLGFSDPDDQWFYQSALGGTGLNSALGATVPGSTKLGTVNFALSVITNNTGYVFKDQNLVCEAPGFDFFDCNGDGKAQIVGSADILGGLGLTNGAFGRSDTDAQFNVIPEPTSLALLGAGIAAIGANRRKSSLK